MAFWIRLMSICRSSPEYALNGKGARSLRCNGDTVADQLSALQVQHAIHQFGERDLNRRSWIS